MRGPRLAVVGALALLVSLLMPSVLLAQGEPGEAPGDQIRLAGSEAVAPSPAGAEPEDEGEGEPGADRSGESDRPDGRAEAPEEAGEPAGQAETAQSDPPEPAGAEHSPREPRATASQATTVRIGDFFFAPETITVEVGDTVTWVNNGEVPEGHTATARDGSFDTGVLQSGESGSHTFTQAGTFPYICSLHPDRQRGTVTVRSAVRDVPESEPGAPAEPGSEPGTADSPDAAGAEDRADRRKLPATGLEVLPLLLAGIVFLALGVALGRRTRLG